MTDGIEVSFQPPMDETDKKVLIGLAVEMRVPVFLFYKDCLWQFKAAWATRYVIRNEEYELDAPFFLVDIYKDGYFRFPKKENGNSRF